MKLQSIGLDVGYYATKSHNGYRTAIFRSAVGTYDQNVFSMNGTERMVMREPAECIIGEYAEIQSGRSASPLTRDWHGGEVWYRLALAGLAQLITAPKAELALVSGLPIAHMADRRAVQDRLKGTHQMKFDNRAAQEVTVKISQTIPQPFGSAFDVIFDGNGKVARPDLTTAKFGVADLGGGTFNFLSAYKLSDIPAESHSVDGVGVRSVTKRIRRYLDNHFPGLHLSEQELMSAIIAQEVAYFGETVSIAEQVAQEVAQLSAQVLDLMGQ